MGLLFLRVLPVAAFLLVSRRFSCRSKLSAAVALSAGILAVCEFDPSGVDLVCGALVVYAYFAAAALCSAAIFRRTAPGRRGVGLTALLATLFVLVPGVVDVGPLHAFQVAVGFEMFLSSYSIGADGYTHRGGPTVAEHVLFVCVNPVLVYSDKGELGSARPLLGVARTSVGLATILLGRVVGALAAAAGTNHGWFALAHLYLLGLCTYFRHSGLASVQIGLMAAVGVRVPERYRYPLLAASPVDFWRRWNTYVGAWARRYLFVPFARYLGRTRCWQPRWCVAVSVVATFGTIGLLHDGVSLAIQHQPTCYWSLFFLWHGLVVVAWAALTRRAGGAPPPLGAAWTGHFSWVATVTLALVGIAIVAASRRTL